MVSMPDRNWSDPWGGFGVVGREGMGVTDRDTTPFSLLSLDSGYDHWAQRPWHISVYWLLEPSFQDITCTEWRDEYVFGNQQRSIMYCLFETSALYLITDVLLTSQVGGCSVSILFWHSLTKDSSTPFETDAVTFYTHDKRKFVKPQRLENSPSSK